MRDSAKRSELIAAIAELQKRQLESYRQPVFGGWSREEEAAHDTRAERLKTLVVELAALDGRPGSYSN